MNEGIYCGFYEGTCPLGVVKTEECRVIKGYECPYFCNPEDKGAMSCLSMSTCPSLKPMCRKSRKHGWNVNVVGHQRMSSFGQI